MASPVSGQGQPSPPIDTTSIQTGTGAPAQGTEAPAGKLVDHAVILDPKPFPDGIRHHEGLQNNIQLTVEAVGNQDPSDSPKLQDHVTFTDISLEVEAAEARGVEGKAEITFEAVEIPNDLPNSIQVKVEQGEAEPIEKGRVSSQVEDMAKKGKLGGQKHGPLRILDIMNKMLDQIEQWNLSHMGR